MEYLLLSIAYLLIGTIVGSLTYAYTVEHIRQLPEGHNLRHRNYAISAGILAGFNWPVALILVTGFEIAFLIYKKVGGGRDVLPSLISKDEVPRQSFVTDSRRTYVTPPERRRHTVHQNFLNGEDR